MVALIPASILVNILGTFAINVGFHNFKSSKRVNGVPPSLGNATDPPNKTLLTACVFQKYELTAKRKFFSSFMVGTNAL